MQSAVCPSENVLWEWLAGQLAPEQVDEVEAHLDTCAGCREVVRQAQSHRSPGSARPLAAAAVARLPPGTKIGRYVVADMLGQGGMGIVYAAHDPELDRKVALKLLHANDGAGESAAHGSTRARLLREAQAMAKLSHSNVVTVFDVGVAEGRLFIAMELIEGTTLASAIEAEPPRRRVGEVLRPFIAAGRGLAAAHAAGFVHRDFKPANVLVGRDGRVCVSDFGLARVVAEEAPAEEPALTAGADLAAATLTRTGALVGTPRYMAPEQLRGEPADARSDQFSFCVALYQALYGEPPFAGGSFAELSANVRAGNVRDPPRGSRVPPRLRRALQRGLSVDATARHPSMTALLRELERNAGRQRRWGLLAAGALLGLLALALASARTKPQSQLCQDGAARWAGIWDAPSKTRVRDAFRRVPQPSALAAWSAIERGFDGFVGAWVDAYRDGCEATRLRGEQSAELFERRMDCMNEELSQAAALLSLLAGADGDARWIDRAAQAMPRPERLARCANVRALRQRQPPPAAGQARSVYTSLRRQLAEVDVLVSLGLAARAQQALEPLVPRAREHGHPVLLSEALRHDGAVQLAGGAAAGAQRAFHEAAAAAERGADYGRAALAWDSLALAAAKLGRIDEATRWLDHAAAAAVRAGADPVLAASHRRAAEAVSARRQ